jgi:hypothetical protein
MLDEMHARLLRLARDTNTPMVDVDAIFRARSETRIPGNQLLVDHVHPDIHGHQMIADALLRSLEGLHVVAPRADHRERQEQLYRDHVASLENTYFVRGKERLEGLRRWAEGRSNNIRAGD